VRQLGVGNAPTIPALQAAITNSGPETRNIGAANTGIRRDCGKRGSAFGLARAETSSRQALPRTSFVKSGTPTLMVNGIPPARVRTSIAHIAKHPL
jgi:hypothetical protein